MLKLLAQNKAKLLWILSAVVLFGSFIIAKMTQAFSPNASAIIMSTSFGLALLGAGVHYRDKGENIKALVCLIIVVYTVFSTYMRLV